MNDQAQQQLAAIHERHEKATADAIETFKQRHPHWNIPTEDEIASCYEAYFGDGEVKFLLTLLADAEAERDEAENVAAMEHAAGRCVLEACKLLEQDCDQARTELAAKKARLDEIDKWVKADADDLAEMRDGTKLTRAGLVSMIVEAQLLLKEEEDEHQATATELAAAHERAEKAADARQAEIADQLEERAAKLRHIGQTDKSNELVYVAGLLRADAIERGEFREKGVGDAT